MVFFSFIGKHDHLTDENIGPCLKIYLRFKKSINQVYLLVSKCSSYENDEYLQIAHTNKYRILQENHNVKVEIIELDMETPIDFDIVYPTILDSVYSILEQNKLTDEEKIINISSGTPTMTTCWVLLAQSGLVKKAKLYQSFENKYAQQKGTSTQEVNLSIDDFPRINKPNSVKRKLTILNREKNQLQRELKNHELDQKIPELIGTSQSIREIKDQLLRDINEDTNVLITGERGTGKQVVANTIWRLYHNIRDTELLTFDCGTFPKELITAELFGYKKGAFTGATHTTEGILASAHNRMIFLDEIGNMLMDGQNNLLRFLNSGEIRKIGDTKTIKINTQIIAATNKNIGDPAIFAQDLKDRFDDIIILPPLRNRKTDIPKLIDHFLKKYAKQIMIFDGELMDNLIHKKWPGNIRELENFIRKIIRRFPDKGEVRLGDLPKRFEILAAEDSNDHQLPDLPLKIPLDEYNQKIINKARELAEGKLVKVDRLLNQQEGTEKQRQYRLRQKKE